MKNLNCLFIGLTFLFSTNIIFSQEITGFDSKKWDLKEAKKSEYLGRQCISGNAYLKDVNFQNGVIEFDLAVNGERSYPGILFRIQNEAEYERFYIRPHLPKNFQNILQYVAAFNGIDSWQIYNGPGMTASASIPLNQWFHIKMEVLNNQARVFLNNAKEPNLFIDDLAHGISKGSLGLNGPDDGSAYFSNFSYKEDNNLKFPKILPKDIPLGMITDWEISQVFPLNHVDPEKLPLEQGINDIKWQKITGLPNGLVDISRFRGRLGSNPDIIWAKTTIKCDNEEEKKYAFGYSDIIFIFLNGKLLFAGNSAYTSRDPSFQGIIGLNDEIHLPLKKGDNELFIALAESFGGWGFIFQDCRAIYQHKNLKKEWELANKLNYPESIVYDKKRDVLYVSNMYNEGKEFISKIKPNGEIEKMEWVKGIYQPTGLCMNNDKLYAVGRFNLLEIDPESGSITKRFPFPSPGFPNDVTADNEGNLYVTDSRKNCIYKLVNDKFEVWLTRDDFKGANGILADKNKLLVGTSSDASIKVIDLTTKEVSVLISLSAGSVMDGLKSDGNGNYLISDYFGRIFKVTSKGESTLLLNTKAPKYFTADFEYTPEKKLLVIPSLEDNRIICYKIIE
jgi:sugar lactone lactonase YvrE